MSINLSCASKFINVTCCLSELRTRIRIDRTSCTPIFHFRSTFDIPSRKFTTAERLYRTLYRMQSSEIYNDHTIHRRKRWDEHDHSLLSPVNSRGSAAMITSGIQKVVRTKSPRMLRVSLEDTGYGIRTLYTLVLHPESTLVVHFEKPTATHLNSPRSSLSVLLDSSPPFVTPPTCTRAGPHGP
jgi:hypothetical protein